MPPFEYWIPPIDLPELEEGQELPSSRTDPSDTVAVDLQTKIEAAGAIGDPFEVNYSFKNKTDKMIACLERLNDAITTNDEGDYRRARIDYIEALGELLDPNDRLRTIVVKPSAPGRNRSGDLVFPSISFEGPKMAKNEPSHILATTSSRKCSVS